MDNKTMDMIFQYGFSSGKLTFFQRILRILDKYENAIDYKIIHSIKQEIYECFEEIKEQKQ